MNFILYSLIFRDFASNVLNCDCRLQWLVKWTKVTGVRISQSTQCVYPHGLLDTPLRSLKRKDLHCGKSWCVVILVVLVVLVVYGCIAELHKMC